MTEVAPSVGGGAIIGRSRVAQASAPCAEGIAAPHIQRIVRAAQQLDPHWLQAELDLAAAVLGLARCVDDIVIPAIRHLALLLATDELDPAQDLMATEAVRTWLSHRRSSAPPPKELGPILLACGPRDRQVVVLESLALLLRDRRWPCQVLGARVSTFTLTIAAQAAGATGVVIFSTESGGRQQAVDSLEAVNALGIPVYFGGDAFAGDAFASEYEGCQVPGRYLGAGIERACALIISTLAPAARGMARSPESELHDDVGGQ